MAETSLKEPLVQLTQSEYEALKYAADTLDAFYAAGVDNWEGYGHVVWPEDVEDEEN